MYLLTILIIFKTAIWIAFVIKLFSENLVNFVKLWIDFAILPYFVKNIHIFKKICL